MARRLTPYGFPVAAQLDSGVATAKVAPESADHEILRAGVRDLLDLDPPATKSSAKPARRTRASRLSSPNVLISCSSMSVCREWTGSSPMTREILRRAPPGSRHRSERAQTAVRCDGRFSPREPSATRSEIRRRPWCGLSIDLARGIRYVPPTLVARLLGIRTSPRTGADPGRSPQLIRGRGFSSRRRLGFEAGLPMSTLQS